MNDPKTLINRVAQSSLKTIDLEQFYPEEEIVSFDLKDYLFKGLILKEMDFRTAIKEFNWETLKNKILCVYCSADAIIPTWAYMLIAKSSSGFVKNIFYGKEEEAIIQYFDQKLRQMDWSSFKDAKVVVKGCSHKPVPAAAYQTLTFLLLPHCSSILYGEPCSTVPIYKARKSLNFDNP